MPNPRTPERLPGVPGVPNPRLLGFQRMSRDFACAKCRWRAKVKEDAWRRLGGLLQYEREVQTPFFWTTRSFISARSIACKLFIVERRYKNQQIQIRTSFLTRYAGIQAYSFSFSLFFRFLFLFLSTFFFLFLFLFLLFL